LSFKKLRVEESEKIGDEDCFVLSVESPVSKRETYWISKASYLIRKYSRTLERPEGDHVIAELSEEQIEEGTTMMGWDVTEENRKRFRDFQKLRSMRLAAKMKGAVVEQHDEISFPQINNADFAYALPADAVLVQLTERHRIPTAELDDATRHRWEKVKLQVASMVDMNDRFRHSITIFTSGGSRSKKEYEYIVGNADANIDNFPVVHILGDLNADVQLSNHGELIVAGSVGENAKIRLGEIGRVFIGGSLHGTVWAEGSSGIIIMGNHTGVIETGDPRTSVLVHGDFTGKLRPAGKKGALVALTVRGFTDIKTIERIYASNYTVLNGSFFCSNMAPGIYQPNAPYSTYYAILKEGYENQSCLKTLSDLGLE
jgi:hypothetical protein